MIRKKVQGALAAFVLALGVVAGTTALPAHAALGGDIVACRAAMTSWSRGFHAWDVSGTGSATCTSDNTLIPTVTNVSITVSMGEGTCEFTGATLTNIAVGGHTYGFSYFGVGTANAADSAQVWASRDGFSYTAPASVPDPVGELAWSDLNLIDAQACGGVGPIFLPDSIIQFAFTGHIPTLT